MPTQDPRRSGNPAVRANAPAPGSADESTFHRWSRAVLVRIAAMPTLTLPLVIAALLLVGLAAPLPVALPALVVTLAIVVWLAVLSWPVIDSRAKVIRVVMVGLVLFSIVGRIIDFL